MTPLTLLLLMTLMFWLPSWILVVRTPISTTVPVQSPTVTMSPTWNSPSKMMKRPARMSETSVCAPRPTIRVRIPAEASSVAVSMPSSARQK